MRLERSGKHFDLLNPTPDMIRIDDIMLGLARIYRYLGQTRRPISVAEHCIHCAREARTRELSQEIQLACLMHDAAEAYIGDLIGPIKSMLEPDSVFLRIEAAVSAAIAVRFGLPERFWELPIVKEIDKYCGGLERTYPMGMGV